MGVSKFCGDSYLCSQKITQSIMDYFELYYAYLAWCERDNRANMRDPVHDYMEWNHTLPRCLFEDQAIGQWLSKGQHAIASALQTLAFRYNCLCGWHKKYLPAELWQLVYPFYAEMSAKNIKKVSPEVHLKRYINCVKASKKEIKVTCPNGEQVLFSSASDAALHFKVSNASITKYLRRGKTLTKGRAKGFTFELS